MQIEQKIKAIENARKEKEQERAQLAGEQQYILQQINADAAKIKELGYVVTNKKEALELYEKKKPELESLVLSLYNKLGLEE